MKLALHGGHERGHGQSAVFSPESLSFASHFGQDADLRIASFHDHSQWRSDF